MFSESISTFPGPSLQNFRIWNTNLFCLTGWGGTGWMCFKGALSGLRQYLSTESPLEMMKNAFYFTSKALFALKIFKFLSWLFGHVSKRLNKKDKLNLKFYDVTAWSTNNCNTHIPQYRETSRQSSNEIWSVNRM